MAQQSIKSFCCTPARSQSNESGHTSHDTGSSNVVDAASGIEDSDASIQCAQRNVKVPTRKSKSQSGKKTKQAKKAARKQRALGKKTRGKNASIACSPNMISSIEISEECNLNSTDKSLTELLATDNVTPNATSSPSQSAGRTKDALNDQIRELQKCVSDLSKQNSLLQNQIDLLESELENSKKVNKTSKSEIKRITKDNDNLRRELSRIKGLRKYTDDQNATENDGSNKCESDDLQTANAKLDSLRIHVADVAQTLLSLAGEQRSEVSAAATTCHQQQLSQPATTSKESFPIPVVQLGLARREAATSTSTSPTTAMAAHSRETYAHVTACQPRQQPNRRPTSDKKVCVVSTSLTRGLGQRLLSQGVSATTYSYPGANIPLIRSRVPHIFPKNNEPTTILLQCGGNDTVNRNPDPIIDQYEGLIKDIRRQRPNSDILISTIPPRRKNKETINYINDFLGDRGARNDRVRLLEAVTKALKYFSKDEIHFNENGKQLYARNIAAFLSNFTRSRPNFNM